MSLDGLQHFVHGVIITDQSIGGKESVSMKAVQMTSQGAPDVLRPVSVPDPRIESPTRIRVRVRAAGVNPVDTKVRSRGLFYPDALPAILGLDGAGVVERVGREVTRFKPGDEVWYCNGGLGADPGNYAEYHLIDEADERSKQ